ncbi:F-box protein SKIP14 [Humulus lupulus]|uniref:F-box protein SKIP14 n=1 Tax=Humulus lupulus TaxID=3486 RepID=UPI002B416262|nr:F-box protein SKIP14 [Humulus lupulus]XP_062105529.1 F-box protein SKIP14 [Humulus lupulus]
MALNFSSHSSPEQSLSSTLLCSDGSFMNLSKKEDLNGKCDSGFQSCIWESKNLLWSVLDLNEKDDGCGEQQRGNDDILAWLPVDPFGMRSVFTAITGQFEDFEKGIEPGSGFSFSEEKIDDDGGGGVSAGFMWFQSELNDVKYDEISMPCNKVNGFGVNNGLFDGGFVLNGDMEDFLRYMDVEDRIFNDEVMETGDSQGQGDAHEAISYALRFLDYEDLLSVERVCKSLREYVIGDSLLWRSINIGWPFCQKINDDTLVKLTSKAEGALENLSLVHCNKITADGLQRVFDNNPKLTKLCLYNCNGISLTDFLCNLSSMKSAGILGLKHLRVGELFDVRNKHLEELKFLLDADSRMPLKGHKPRFYSGGLSPCFSEDDDDDRVIDVETCPKCQQPMVVYDCPTESCRENHQTTQLCRACILCIERCCHCGRCIDDDTDYVETICLNLLCLDCIRNILRDTEKMPGGDKGSICRYMAPVNRYEFCFIS